MKTLAAVLLSASAAAATATVIYTVVTPCEAYSGNLGTYNNFEDPGTPYTFTKHQNDPAATVVADSAQLTLGGSSGQINSAVFDRADTGAFASVRAQFDFRFMDTTGDGADGMGFMLLPTATFATSGAAPGLSAYAEEPNYPGALGVGFDIYYNPGIDINANHASLHWNGSRLAQVDVGPLGFTLENGGWFSADIRVEPVTGGSNVTVILTCGATTAAVFSDYFVAGLDPYEYRAGFMARAGAATCTTRLDNVHVRAIGPEAVSDRYHTLPGQALSVAAPGVLANDTGDGSALSASLVTDASHGTLSLGADGSFSYTPEGGFSGQDSFTYKATYATQETNTVLVTLDVTSPSITLSASTLGPGCLQGQDATAQTFTVRNSGGDTLNYTISDDVGWLSCSPASGSSTGEADTITVTYDTDALAAGVHNATITVEAVGADNTPRTIPVALTVLGPHIVLNKATLTPSCLQGADAAVTTFTVRNSGGATLNYTIDDDAGWLSCSPATGSSTGETDTITVTYDTDTLTPGTYTATITVTSADADNSPQIIAVTLTVVGPHIVLNKTTLTQSTLVGTDGAAQTFTVRNSGGGTLNYTIDDNVAWLACTPVSGDSTGDTDTITVSYDTDALAPGPYTATITVTSADADNSPQTIAVTMNVVGPHIMLSTATLNPTCLQGADAADQTFTVRNSGGGTLNYTIGDNVAWLACTPVSGDSTTDIDTITVSYDTDSLTPGTHSATITVTSPDADNDPQTIAVTLTVVGPHITLSAATLTPSCFLGTDAADQTFTVRNSAGGTMSYTVDDDVGWLSCSPASGDSSGETDTITVTYDTDALAPGTHTATITVTAPDADNSPRTIAVTLTVIRPRLALSPATLRQYGFEGSDATDQTFTIRNSTGGPMNYTVDDDAAWLSCNPASGDSTGEADTITVSYDTDALAAGTYSATITVTSPEADNSPQTIAVTLIVSAPTAIGLSPASMTFAAYVGANPASQPASVTNTLAGSTLRWTAWSDKPWLQLSPTWGTTTTETDTLSVSAVVSQAEAWGSATSNTGTPPSSENGASTWTGKEMIVWGGVSGPSWASTDTGGRYDPATDTWSAITMTGAPSARHGASAVWTGREVIVWGGRNSSTYYNTGYRYDPANDCWLGTISAVSAPTARTMHRAVWTGTEMIVWGGQDASGFPAAGGRYNPTTDTWSPMTTTGVPTPRYTHAAVWTGTRMVIWGGANGSTNLNSGASYDPATDSWSGPISTTGAPSARRCLASVWTGREMVVWGGYTSAVINSGARYDPATDTWLGATTTAGGLSARANAFSAWTGTEMIVWGGNNLIAPNMLSDGKRYKPPISLAAGTYNGTVTVTDANATNNPQTVAVTLTVTPPPPPTIGLTPASMDFTASVGTNPASQPASVTNPVADSTLRWTAWTDKPWLQLSPSWDTTTTETDTLSVSAVVSQSEAWTGSTTLTGAPVGREDLSAIWTGKEMIVWGGRIALDCTSVNTGARYDPVTDTWTGTTTTTGAPTGRRVHSAVWTGKEMIVWGGADSAEPMVRRNDGYRYDPVADAWLGAISTTNAPLPRRSHSAVWTGTEMIIWGGEVAADTATNTGARYNPATDTWTPMTTDNAPSARVQHCAVWTGTEMIVWSGYQGSTYLNTGARYNPATDTWTAVTSTTGAPSARRAHSAVWTGSEMIVWGGANASGLLNTGARYDPATDSWLGATTTSGAPASRVSGAAVWTGREMIVWGGGNGSYMNTGGRYRPPISLAAGTYAGTVTVRDPLATNNAQTVAVTLTVEQATIGLSPATMAFSTPEGVNPASQGASITNTGSSTLRWTAWSDKPWLQLSPTWGTTTVETDTLGVSAVVSQAEAWGAATSTTGAPADRRMHSMVWTGSEIIVWGGGVDGVCIGTGARYDPAADTWLDGISMTDAPAARYAHTAVWTGKEMIVWGGRLTGGVATNTGARYDPRTDTWTAMSTVNAPAARALHSAVWTGSEMIVWSGYSGTEYLASGGRYNPSTNTWTGMSQANAPSARNAHCAVWTGTDMIVSGGWQGGDDALTSGARYSPATDSWLGAIADAPFGLTANFAVWTGKEMVIWGGAPTHDGVSDAGARYNPTTNIWQVMSASGPPSARREHRMVWTGTEVIVWGGYDHVSTLNTGKRYKPPINLTVGTYTGTVTVTDPVASNNPRTVAVTLTVEPPTIGLSPATMTFTAGEGANPASQDAAVTNTGVSTLRWTAGGDKPWLQVSPAWGTTTAETDTLGVSPVVSQAESWSATSTTGAPQAREDHSAVWTGKEMIIWGGNVYYAHQPLGTGGKYDPLTDTWTGATSASGAPSARRRHSGVWTGREMIVWGGWDTTTTALADGYRYDPASDSWLGTISTVGAPAARRGHTAVWTGTEMIVWGGQDGGTGVLKTGGRYNSATNAWSTMNSADAPAARRDHVAVWTGTEMIVWGGADGGSNALKTGARYNPAADSWAAISEPAGGRGSARAAWTGQEMVVWGGYDGSNDLNTGMRYNPTTDTWVESISTTGAPTKRHCHSAVWTGKEMVVWGGFTVATSYVNTGGRYYPPIALTAGTYTGTVTVSDPKATNNPQTIAVTLHVNGRPVITSFDPTTPFSMVAGTSQLFSVTADDPEGDTLTYAWEIDGEAAGTDTSSMTYSPTEADVGARIIKVTVTDGHGGSDSQTWNVTVTTAIPAIARSPAALTPACNEGQDAAQQTFDVWNSGGNTLSYTVSDDAGWLSCSPASGSSTGEHDVITVTYDTDTLAPGTHTATITVADAGASNTPQTVSVTLTVGALPRIGLSPATLVPTCKQGQIAAAQTFEVWNAGVDTLAYTVSDDVDWLSCAPASGTSTGEHDLITVTYDTSALAAGTHTATITVADAGAANTPQTIAVTLTVTRKSSSGGGSGCALAATPAGAAGLAGWLLPYLAATALFVGGRLRRRSKARRG